MLHDSFDKVICLKGVNCTTQRQREVHGIYSGALLLRAPIFLPPLTYFSISNGRCSPDIISPADHSRCQSVCILSFAAGSLKQLPHSLWTLLYLPALITELLT